MDERKLREQLELYQNMCMDALNPKKMTGYNHKYSKKFSRKMKKLLWSRKHFGNDIRLGYIVRRVAIFVATLLSLLAANEVSARLFGFDAWKTIRSMVDGGKGVQIEYKKIKSEEELAKPKHKEPTYVPEGFAEIERDETTSFFGINWKKSENELLRYSRDRLAEGDLTVYDAEYDKKKKASVADFNASVIYDNGEIRLIWCDESYEYMIDCYQVAEEELFKMAESIYQE